MNRSRSSRRSRIYFPSFLQEILQKNSLETFQWEHLNKNDCAKISLAIGNFEPNYLVPELRSTWRDTNCDCFGQINLLARPGHRGTL